MWTGAILQRLLRGAMPGFILRRGAADDAHVYLTFDDGPDIENTPLILEALRQHRVKATFFVLGSACERSPEIVRQMMAEGHLVANHGYEHLPPSAAPGRRYIDNVLRGQAVIEKIAARSLARLFRPPFGALGARALWDLWRHDFQVVLWSVDSLDSKAGATAQTVTERLRPGRVAAGDIVLLHDDYARTATALPAVLERLQESGHVLTAFDRDQIAA